MPDNAGADLLSAGARLAGHADLSDVRTFKLEAECLVVPAPGQRLGFDFEFAVLDSELDEDSLTVACRCHVALFLVSDHDDNEDARTEVGELSVVLGALFEVRPLDDGEFAQAEVDAFCETTVRFALFPYARAAVADLTGRLGLPHLNLPTLKIALPAPGAPSSE